MSEPNKLNLNYVLNNDVELFRGIKDEDESRADSNKRTRKPDLTTSSASMSSLSVSGFNFTGTRYNDTLSNQNRSAILTSPSVKKLHSVPERLHIENDETEENDSQESSSSKRNAHSRNFKCDICHKSFFERAIFLRRNYFENSKRSNHVTGNLNKHVSSVHLKEKPKVCPEQGCGKSFSFRDGLMRHISHVHRNERLHVCIHCKKSFKQASHLGKHMRTIHKTS